MPRQAIKASPAMARFLRECRREAGLTLRQVQERTREVGEPIPSSTVCKIEQGKVEPGLVRVRALLDVYHRPLHEAANLLELEELVGPAPPEDPPERLYETGVTLMKQGQVREALRCLLPLRPRRASDGPLPKLQQRALITIAIGLQRIGKLRLAFSTIETLLSDRNLADRDLLLHAHVQAARIWLDLGATEIALAFLARARAHRAEGDIRAEAWILGNEAQALAADHRFEEAIEVAARAADLLERSGDEGNLLAVRTQLAQLKFASGDTEGCLATAESALASGDESRFEDVRTRASLWKGRALVRLGRVQQGLDTLREALTAAIEMDDLLIQFLAHYHLWKAYGEVGETMRAEFELGAARTCLRHIDEDTEEAREIRALDEAS